MFGIMTGLQAGRCGVGNLAGPRDLSFFQSVQAGSGALPASYTVGTGFFPKAKVAGA